MERAEEAVCFDQSLAKELIELLRKECLAFFVNCEKERIFVDGLRVLQGDVQAVPVK